MKARTPRKHSAPRVRYHSRPMMLQLLSDLCDRIKNQRHELVPRVIQTEGTTFSA